MGIVIKLTHPEVLQIPGSVTAKKKNSNLSSLFDCKWMYWKCASFSFRNQSLFDWSSFSHNQL